MKPLIDADILLHEIGWSGQFKDKETGEEVLLPFSTLQEILDKKIEDICEGAGGDEPPILFFTSSPRLVQLANQVLGDDWYEHTDGFRYEVAVSRPYKGTRKQEKPFHFYNIAAYLMSAYPFHLSEKGLEADDMMSIFQASDLKYEDTIICSRDKDLRITPGWHYSWECGLQREIGPHYTDSIGSLTKDEKGKVLGYGLKFFYYQMLIGDAVDNIPGCPGVGPVKAYAIISPLTTKLELYEAVKSLYKEKGMPREYFLEQANLLWIRQGIDEGYKEPS